MRYTQCLTCQGYLYYSVYIYCIVAGGETTNGVAVEEQLKGGLGNQDKRLGEEVA